ncbi:MAG: nitroreductase family deazaflavin-dependent oxidoreductase [Streptosporangiales bacterium]|nr:nitroreductase family deazaflavin-dependent oxidoreductase [Streptosporangiales bacterium]
MRMIDRIMRRAVAAGIGARSTALLETIGRKSGLPRVTPVTNGLDGDVFWLVTEHGHATNYVRNLQADPKVRVKVSGRWRPGVARIVDEDPEIVMNRISTANPRARANVAIVRRTGTEHLVIRIDLT